MKIRGGFQRVVQIGEIIQQGDWWANAGCDSTSVGNSLSCSQTLLRPVVSGAEQWIDVKVRQPSKVDALRSWGNYLLFIQPDGSARYGQPTSDVAKMATHWLTIRNLPVPAVPALPEVHLDESGHDRLVVINADGSINVGCVHVLSDQFDTIVANRKQIANK